MANEIKKDYMGLISWNRVTCGAPQPLFGSDIKTDSPVCIRICQAHISEDPCYDGLPEHRRIFGKHPCMLEIEMTPIQWAEFLTAGHVDDGVPCTITHINGKRTEPVQARNVAAEYDIHIQNKFDEFENSFKRMEQTVQDVLDSGKSMSKSQMKELLRSMSIARQNTVANIKYARDRFKEDMASIVVKAKAEVNAYAELRLGNYGVKCIMDDRVDEVISTKEIENDGPAGNAD